MIRRLLVVLVMGVLVIPFANGVSRAAGTTFGVQKTMHLSTGTLTFFDLTWVDQTQQAVYVADSGNGTIDIFDAKKNKLITQFKPTPNFNTGPNGMMVTSDTHQAYVGDTVSLTWHIDVSKPSAPKVVAMINTGGAGDCDEESYDPKDGLVLMTNPHETTPFISLIGTTGANADKVVKKITFPNAAPGVSMFGSALEQSVYDPETGLFYMQLQQTVSPGAGEIDSIDPKTFAVKTVVSTGNCVGTGLAFDEKNQRLYLGCSGEVAVATPLNSDLFMAYDVVSNELTTIAGPTGNSDETWFNPHNGLAYVANAFYITNFPSAINASVGIIDTKHNDTVLNFLTGDTMGVTILHSIAVDQKNNHVFVPLAANSLPFDNDKKKGTSCTSGCVAVMFGSTPKDNDGD